MPLKLSFHVPQNICEQTLISTQISFWFGCSINQRKFGWKIVDKAIGQSFQMLERETLF